MATVRARLDRLERRATPPACCPVRFTVCDHDGTIIHDAGPTCRHGRPWAASRTPPRRFTITIDRVAREEVPA